MHTQAAAGALLSLAPQSWPLASASDHPFHSESPIILNSDSSSFKGTAGPGGEAVQGKRLRGGGTETRGSLRVLWQTPGWRGFPASPKQVEPVTSPKSIKHTAAAAAAFLSALLRLGAQKAGWGVMGHPEVCPA